ncbi:thiamine phosphate synthase [Undibacter mobilis]|uniref:Thiamine phosphate synthase n=1 Tax=Undibacter mobilis TaxID=2292256 RepID=A0A371BAX4_9BRAD|nr:thiamine phosphate synthase [Undibacter mobilis]RDV04756.1 thiamine phosphate synthase [Undibacter mobilis]
MAQRPKIAEPRPQPRLYLITPPIADAAAFAPVLKAALAAGDVAAVLLRLAEGDDRTQINRVKALAPIAQGAGAALLLDGHAGLVARSGADGAHVAASDVADALEVLKPDWVVGVGGVSSRHDAMTAAEAGCDYVMFGESDARGQRPPFELVIELLSWWAEVFEIPCIAYAATIEEITPLIGAGADFVAVGDQADDWIWRNPPSALAALTPLLKLPEAAL